MMVYVDLTDDDRAALADVREYFRLPNGQLEGDAELLRRALQCFRDRLAGEGRIPPGPGSSTRIREGYRE